MNGVEFKELFKVAVETLREKTITPLLEADVTYQEDSENEGIAEMHYLQLDLTDEQRKVCNRLLECRDKQDIEYATHAYIAGLYDAFQIMAVLFPDKWNTTNEEEIEVQTETLAITAAPLANGYVKARTGDSTTDTVYTGWYTSVYMPAVTDPETSGIQQSSQQDFEEEETGGATL